MSQIFVLFLLFVIGRGRLAGIVGEYLVQVVAINWHVHEAYHDDDEAVGLLALGRHRAPISRHDGQEGLRRGAWWRVE